MLEGSERFRKKRSLLKSAFGRKGFIGLAVFFALLLPFWIFGYRYSSRSTFCFTCHQMRSVREGWLVSAHGQNQQGIIAECVDCHLPRGYARRLWAKTYLGSKAIVVHFSRSAKNWAPRREALSAKIRAEIPDDTCRACHPDLLEPGCSPISLAAHRGNLLLKKPRDCLDCHREEFH